MAQYKLGDYLVRPGHGVGKISSIESQEICGATQTFYIIQLMDGPVSSIMVPVDNADSVGLRPIISRGEADRVINILLETEVKIDNQTWNRRYREYMEKIKTGSVYEIAEVLRDLYLLKVDKDLSFGERDMLKKARQLLLRELSLATGRDRLEGQESVKAILGLEG